MRSRPPAERGELSAAEAQEKLQQYCRGLDPVLPGLELGR